MFIKVPFQVDEPEYIPLFLHRPTPTKSPLWDVINTGIYYVPTPDGLTKFFYHSGDQGTVYIKLIVGPIIDINKLRSGFGRWI